MPSFVCIPHFIFLLLRSGKCTLSTQFISIPSASFREWACLVPFSPPYILILFTPFVRFLLFCHDMFLLLLSLFFFCLYFVCCAVCVREIFSLTILLLIYFSVNMHDRASSNQILFHDICGAVGLDIQALECWEWIHLFMCALHIQYKLCSHKA